jgi:hypothetical protein
MLFEVFLVEGREASVSANPPPMSCSAPKNTPRTALRALARTLIGSPLSRPVAALLFSAPVACASGDPQFSAKYASDFNSGPASVSVFGVFRAGRLNAETWLEIGPLFSRIFGQDLCESAHAGSLLGSNLELASAVDAYTRENGVTEELLAQFAPASKGDLILVVTITGGPQRLAGEGRAPSPEPGKATNSPQGASSSRRGQGRTVGGKLRGLGGRPLPRLKDPNHPGAPAPLGLSAALYSVRLRHSVAVFDLTSSKYSNPDVQPALESFAQQLGASIPGSTCNGWKRDFTVDPQRIRQSIEAYSPEEVGH